MKPVLPFDPPQPWPAAGVRRACAWLESPGTPGRAPHSSPGDPRSAPRRLRPSAVIIATFYLLGDHITPKSGQEVTGASKK
jgi:hypothetical protein